MFGGFSVDSGGRGSRGWGSRLGFSKALAAVAQKLGSVVCRWLQDVQGAITYLFEWSV